MHIKVNTQKHNCHNTNLSDKNRSDYYKWIAAIVPYWAREGQQIGAFALRKQLHDKFSVVLTYHIMFDVKKMDLDLIQDKGNVRV